MLCCKLLYNIDRMVLCPPCWIFCWGTLTYTLSAQLFTRANMHMYSELLTEKTIIVLKLVVSIYRKYNNQCDDWNKISVIRSCKLWSYKSCKRINHFLWRLTCGIIRTVDRRLECCGVYTVRKKCFYRKRFIYVTTLNSINSTIIYLK